MPLPRHGAHLPDPESRTADHGMPNPTRAYHNDTFMAVNKIPHVSGKCGFIGTCSKCSEIGCRRQRTAIRFPRIRRGPDEAIKSDRPVLRMVIFAFVVVGKAVWDLVRAMLLGRGISEIYFFWEVTRVSQRRGATPLLSRHEGFWSDYKFLFNGYLNREKSILPPVVSAVEPPAALEIAESAEKTMKNFCHR
jgi:hypothetical protein